MAEHLASWNDTPTTQAIVDFVESAASGVPPEERVATFDNDGTLWCEKPMPIQLDFTLRRLAAMAEEDESLRGEQPWKAAYEKDLKWLGAAVIASGGDRDFMRPIAGHLYGIPPERVIGSSFSLEYQEDEDGTAVLYKPEMEFFDDGPEKPVRIWSRIGRRPLVAGGNSNGDIPMLRFARTPERPALRLLVLHDDAEREFAYTTGAEQALERARERDWTVVSIKDDWATVFAT